MKKHKRRLALCSLIVMLALCASGCGRKTNEGSGKVGFTPRLDTSTDCSITVAGHYENFEALETEFNRFSEYYPNVKMDYKFMDGYSKAASGILTTALAGKEAPDIFFTYPWMSDWADYQIIRDASEDLSDPTVDIDLSSIRPNLLVKDGSDSVLSVPVYTTTYGMLVNEDLFAKENISVPQTYSELLASCEAFKKAGYSDPIMGYNKGGDLLYPMFYPYFCAQI